MPFHHDDPDIQFGLNTLVELGVLKVEGLREFGKAVRVLRKLANEAGLSMEDSDAVEDREDEFAAPNLDDESASSVEESQEPDKQPAENLSLPRRTYRRGKQLKVDEPELSRRAEDTGDVTRIQEAKLKDGSREVGNGATASVAAPMEKASRNTDHDDPEFIDPPQEDTEEDHAPEPAPTRPQRTPNRPLEVGEGQLRLLHKNFTIEQIATMNGCSVAAVQKRLREWGIGKGG